MHCQHLHCDALKASLLYNILIIYVPPFISSFYFLSVSPSLCPSVSPSLCSSVSPSLCLSVSPSVCPRLSVSICLSNQCWRAVLNIAKGCWNCRTPEENHVITIIIIIIIVYQSITLFYSILIYYMYKFFAEVLKVVLCFIPV